MSSNHINYDDVSPELHIKICKKIAQLTKVIYTLNTKIEEHDLIVEKLNEDHAKEIQNVMLQCKTKVEKFQSDCRYSSEKEAELKKIQEILNHMKEENERLQKSLKEHLSNTELNDKQLRNGYENKFLDLQNKFLECKTDYSELRESCNKHPKDFEKRKQKEIDELNAKHKELTDSITLTFEKNIDILKADKLKSESILNEKINSFETKCGNMNSEYKIKEQENESKITKLKQFYEEELKQHEKLNNDASQKEWLEERANIISEFQLKKEELSNRIRYLEKSSDEKDHTVDELQKEIKSLQEKYKDFANILPSLQEELSQKDEEISILKNDLQSFQDKLKVQGEKLEAAKLANDNYKQIEEAYGHVSRSLDDHKKKLTTKTLDYSQLEEIHYQLKTKLRQLEDDNKKLYSLCGNVKNERTMEMDKTKSLEIQLEEKITLILLLEKRLSGLEEKYKVEKEKCLQHEKEIEKLRNEFVEAKDKIIAQHRDQVNILNNNFFEKLKEVQHESSMSLTLQEQDFQNQLEKFNDLIASKDEEIDQIQIDLQQSRSHLDMTKSELEKNVQKSKFLSSGLEDREKGLERTIDQYEGKISVMKMDFQNEKDGMKLTFEKIKGKLTDDHKTQLDILEKKWQYRLKSATEEANELSQHHKRISDEGLDKIMTKHQSEIQQLKFTKDREIQILQNEIVSFEDKIKKLQLDSNDTSKKYDDILSEKIMYFREEQEKLIGMHNNEITELQLKMENYMNVKIAELNIEKQKALEILNNTHEENLYEIRNEHLQSVKALRDQLNSEKQEMIGLAKSQLSIEKEKFQEIVKIQTEEKINAITLDFEARLEESKKALEQSFQLRQQEFLAHSRKISDLTNDLEREKSDVMMLEKNILQAEDKEKYLMNELTNKGEEILKIRRESNSKLRIELDKVASVHCKEKEVIVKEFTEGKIKSYELWESTKAELTDQISSLTFLLEDVEEKFLKRPSREEDVAKLNDLTQKLFQTELECRRLSEERKHYRLELVNREENFNKVFNTSPNVGYINPIELSKRKSSKKR